MLKVCQFAVDVIYKLNKLRNVHLNFTNFLACNGNDFWPIKGNIIKLFSQLVAVFTTYEGVNCLTGCHNGIGFILLGVGKGTYVIIKQACSLKLISHHSGDLLGPCEAIWPCRAPDFRNITLILLNLHIMNFPLNYLPLSS